MPKYQPHCPFDAILYYIDIKVITCCNESTKVHKPWYRCMQAAIVGWLINYADYKKGVVYYLQRGQGEPANSKRGRVSYSQEGEGWSKVSTHFL